jgi:ABC-type Fe3+/spermidine/putrescine transport system ATPase subunit
MLIAENLGYKVGSFALKNINLSLSEHEYFVLLGPTGSGKSTLVKCISGLYKIFQGHLYLNGKEITHDEPESRDIGYLPQNYALFPHLNVQDNILFGLKIRNLSSLEMQERLNNLAEIFGINKLLSRKITNLSGGEMQRVALARALAVHPKVLLLDEPFSAVDPGLKTKLWFEVKSILKHLNITALHITHNLEEASVIGDRLAILIDGKIEQQGKPDEALLWPATEKVAIYQGIKNIYAGEVVQVEESTVKIQSGGVIFTALKAQSYTLKQEVKFCIVPQNIKIIRENCPVREELQDNLFEVEVAYVYFIREFCLVGVKSKVDFELKLPSYIYKRYNLHPGKKITIGVWQSGIHVFRTVDSG